MKIFKIKLISNINLIMDYSFFPSKLLGLIPFGYCYGSSFAKVIYCSVLRLAALVHASAVTALLIYKKETNSEAYDIFQASLYTYLTLLIHSLNEWKNPEELKNIYNEIIRIDRQLKGLIDIGYKFKRYLVLILLNLWLPLSVSVWLAATVYTYPAYVLIMMQVSLMVYTCFCLQVASIYWAVGDQIRSIYARMDRYDGEIFSVLITYRWKLGNVYRKTNVYYSSVSTALTFIFVLHSTSSIGEAVFSLDWSNADTVLLLIYPFLNGIPFYTMLKAVDDASNQVLLSLSVTNERSPSHYNLIPEITAS